MRLESALTHGWQVVRGERYERSREKLVIPGGQVDSTRGGFLLRSFGFLVGHVGGGISCGMVTLVESRGKG